MRSTRMGVVAFFAVALGCGGGSSPSDAGTGSGGSTTHSISGHVSGAVISNVRVSLSGAASASTTTDSSGWYSFGGLSSGSYTVSPALSGFTFSPATASVTVAGADVVQDFTAVGANTISGTLSGAARAGITVTLSGPSSATTTTDAAGHYTFTSLPNGAYTVTPSLAGGYDFAPRSASASLSGAGVQLDFVSFGANTVSGTVSGLMASGVTVTLSGSSSGSATTDASGRYSFTGLTNGTYTVTPSVAGGYVFSPTSATVTLDGASAVQDFVDSGAYGVSGTVSGAASSGVTVALSGSMTGTTTTNAAGQYAFSGLPNGTYTITPSNPGVDFLPATASVTVLDGNVLQNFTSSTACVWQQTAAFPLTSAPAGSVVKNGAAGGQGPASVYGRTAWYQTSDWNLLFVPTGLGASDDVFAVEADLYLPASSGADTTADLEVFTTTGTLPGPNGTCQSSGGVAALLGGRTPTFSWNSTATCPWTKLDSTALGTMAVQWRRLRVEGVRSTCSLRATLDGVLLRAWTGACSMVGSYFVLSSNTAAPSPSNVAWSNMAVFKGNSSVCIPTTTHAISGTVSGLVAGGVTVSLTGAATATTVTDSGGHYRFSGLDDGVYRVTPSLAGGYVFTPSAATVNVAGADVVQDFADFGAYAISGTISGVVTSGVTVTLSGARSATTTTNAVGGYAFDGLPDGTYTVTPSGASYVFSPASATVSLVGGGATRNFSSTLACAWQQVAAYPLTSTPAGSVVRDGASGGQGPASVYGRTAWYQTSDWNLLFVPTGLGAGDDVFAVEADVYLPETSGAFSTADIEVFTTTATLPGPNGTCQSSGGVAALLGGQTPTFSWNSTATCPWTKLDSLSIASPTSQWRRFRVEGVRSTCRMRALLDGSLVRTWTGGCSLGGPYFVLSSNASAAWNPSNVAWSNLTVYRGTATTCIP